jgi:amino acid transporter
VTTSLRQLVGVTVIAAAIVLSTYEIYELVRIGTCGAPPGAVPIRACPDGAGAHVLLLILGIFVLPFLGAYLARNAGLLIAWWCLLWIAMGSAAIVAGHGPAAPPQPDGADAVAITFLAIGILSTLGALALARGVSQSPMGARAQVAHEMGLAPEPPRAAPDPVPAEPISDAELETALDTVEERLQTLKRLRASGLITEQELVERRRRILDEV